MWEIIALAVIIFLIVWIYWERMSVDCKTSHRWGKWEEVQHISHYTTEMIIKRNCKVCGEIRLERRILELK